ncbi:hypothetical protein ACHAWF_006821 [Thalassiosira exigua]
MVSPPSGNVFFIFFGKMDHTVEYARTCLSSTLPYPPLFGPESQATLWMIMPLVRVAARAAPSLRRGRCQPPVPPSPSLSASTLLVSPSDRFHDARAPRTDGRRRHQHQQRPLSAHARPSRPLLAQPHHHVAGATSEQVEASQAMKDYYAANFGGDWRDRPDVIVAGELEDDAPRLGDDDEEDEEEEEEEEEENPSVIRLPEELTKRNIRPLVAYLRAPHEEGSRACRKLRYPGDDNKSKFPLVPGILHGSDPTKGTLSQDPSSRILVKTPWFEVQRELDRYHRGITGSFESRVYALTVFPGEEASLDHHRGRQPRDQTEWRVNEDASALIKIPAPKPPLPPPRTPVEGMENILVVRGDPGLM